MNSANRNLSIVAASGLVPETYEGDIYFWLSISPITLLCYATLLKLPQEIEYIWFKPFSLPTFLYIMSRYGPLIFEGLLLPLNFTSVSALSVRFAITSNDLKSLRTCNVVFGLKGCVGFLSYIGVQGLLVVRGYALCQGSKKLATALVFGFFLGSVLYLYQAIPYYPGCKISRGAIRVADYLTVLITSISVIFTDFLVFGICMWNVWSVWKLRKEAGIQSGCNFVSVLFTQSVSRCCFVIVITVTSSIISVLSAIKGSSFDIYFVAQVLYLFQTCLSAILMADSALDLRRLNSARIEASQVSLPTLQFSNVLQHAHQSFIVELATPKDTNAENLERNEDDDHDSTPGRRGRICG